MRKTIVTIALGALMALGAAAPALASGPQTGETTACNSPGGAALAEAAALIGEDYC